MGWIQPHLISWAVVDRNWVENWLVVFLGGKEVLGELPIASYLYDMYSLSLRKRQGYIDHFLHGS